MFGAGPFFLARRLGASGAGAGGVGGGTISYRSRPTSTGMQTIWAGVPRYGLKRPNPALLMHHAKT